CIENSSEIQGFDFIHRLLKVVESIGDGPSISLRPEVMIFDQFRGTSPTGTGIAEAPDQLFLLVIHADQGQAHVQGSRPQISNEIKLPVAVWMGSSSQFLVVDA
ncbi:MAG: hypothetical protein OXM02_00620, partial [Bacteroidota bacterium]|nr:hypothetical protein [Bacteroidota bacterium]